MRLIPVKSSNIASVGYIASKKVLHASFTNGSLYEYHDVPENVFTECLNAPSVGSYFSKNIARKFVFMKVEDKTCRGCKFFEGNEDDEGGCEVMRCKKFKKEMTEFDSYIGYPVRLEECDEPFFREKVERQKEGL